MNVVLLTYNDITQQLQNYYQIKLNLFFKYCLVAKMVESDWSFLLVAYATDAWVILIGGFQFPR